MPVVYYIVYIVIGFVMAVDKTVRERHYNDGCIDWVKAFILCVIGWPDRNLR